MLIQWCLRWKDILKTLKEDTLMLTFFPEMLPDEFLYSVIARYANIMRYSNLKEVHSQIFGSMNLRSVIEMPTHIDSLISNLPDGHLYTAEEIINNHTFFPYYTAFLSPERGAIIRGYMQGDGGDAIYLFSGITTYSISKTLFLKYCPICITEDIKNYGTSYWHRVHQLPGVEICPQHQVFLIDSWIQTTNKKTLHAYYCAPENNRDNVVKANLKNREDRHLFKIAQDSKWLLDNPTGGNNALELYQKIRELLKYRGWIKSGGKKIYINDLRGEFIRYYSPAFLKGLECYPNDDSHSTWLERLVRKPRVSQHPLRYLLLLHFLGVSVADFMNNCFSIGDDQAVVFSPCINKASDHFGQLTARLQENSRYMEKDRQYFLCPLCGLSYTKGGKSQKTKVVDFGWLWKERLASIANDPNLSIRKMARLMGADSETINKYRHILGITICRETDEVNLEKKKLKEDAAETMQKNYRLLWKGLHEKHPDKSKTELRRLLPGVYIWLYRNDRNWLVENQPPPQKPREAKQRINWSERDQYFRLEAEKVVDAIKNAQGKPVRITVT